MTEEIVFKQLLLDILHYYISNHYALQSDDILTIRQKINDHGGEKDKFIESLTRHEKALFYTSLQQMEWTEWDVVFDVYNVELENLRHKLGFYLLHKLEEYEMENLSSEG